MRSRFTVKICGITRPEDAVAAAAAGADAIGLNFFGKSSRYISEEQAAAVIANAPPDVATVGLFVNATTDQILARLENLGLDWIQLHGDEPPELLQEIPSEMVVRAFRLGPEGLGPIWKYLDACDRLGSMPAMVLLDACQPGEFGGTGHLSDWNAAAEFVNACEEIASVLAGGLKPGNVARSIATVRPAAVDTASGVEGSRGIKDAALMQRFVANARQAFAQFG